MAKQKLVIQVNMHDARQRAKALSVVVRFCGVISATVDADKNQITVVGDGVDSVCLTAKLRKKMGCVELVSVGAAEEKKPAEPKKEDPLEKLKKEWAEKCKKECEEKCKIKCCEGCTKMECECKSSSLCGGCKQKICVCKKIEYCYIPQGCYNPPPPPCPGMCQQVYEEPCYSPSCYIL